MTDLTKRLKGVRDHGRYSSVASEAQASKVADEAMERIEELEKRGPARQVLKAERDKALRERNEANKTATIWQAEAGNARQRELAAERERDEARDAATREHADSVMWHEAHDDDQARIESLEGALREVDGLLRVCEEAPAKKPAQIKKARRTIAAERFNAAALSPSTGESECPTCGSQHPQQHPHGRDCRDPYHSKGSE